MSAPDYANAVAVNGPLANYEIQRRIGSGKFSVVYKARRLKDNSVCALKKVQVFDIKDAKVRCTAGPRPALDALTVSLAPCAIAGAGKVPEGGEALAGVTPRKHNPLPRFVF